MIVLVDSSVWIDHLRETNPALESLLLEGEVATHQVVIGELACGSIKSRGNFLARMMELPRLRAVSFDEVMDQIETARWWGKGLGWIDVQLLAATRNSDAWLWTRDRALSAAAEVAGVAFKAG